MHLGALLRWPMTESGRSASYSSRRGKRADDVGTSKDPLMLPAPETPARTPRWMSPRALAELAHELYLDGSLSWEEYQIVGFPAELHPDFDQTIGALTGERADPDRPRDMVAEWEQRVDFHHHYQRHRPDILERARRILEVLIAEAEAAATRNGTNGTYADDMSEDENQNR